MLPLIRRLLNFTPQRLVVSLVCQQVPLCAPLPLEAELTDILEVLEILFIQRTHQLQIEARHVLALHVGK